MFLSITSMLLVFSTITLCAILYFLLPVFDVFHEWGATRQDSNVLDQQCRPYNDFCALNLSSANTSQRNCASVTHNTEQALGTINDAESCSWDSNGGSATASKYTARVYKEYSKNASNLPYVDPSCLFSKSYMEARTRFRKAVRDLGPQIHLYSLPVYDLHDDIQSNREKEISRQLEERNQVNQANTKALSNMDHDDSILTMDVAVIPGSRRKLLLHVSGNHGLEGFPGSAIQLALLHDWKVLLMAYNNKDTKEDVESEAYSTCSVLMDKIIRVGLETHMRSIPGAMRGEVFNREYTSSSSYFSKKHPECRFPTIVIVHAFNPYGFHHLRRWNENGVDLNRNCIVSKTMWDRLRKNGVADSSRTQMDTNVEDDRDQKDKKSKASSETTEEPNPRHIRPTSRSAWDLYKIFNDVINPSADSIVSNRWKFNSQTVSTFAELIWKYGFVTCMRAVLTGQYFDPRGLFYGGGQSQRPTVTGTKTSGAGEGEDKSGRVFQEASHRVLYDFLKKHELVNDASLSQCLVVDIHSGLGPQGQDTLLMWFPDKGHGRGHNHTQDDHEHHEHHDHEHHEHHDHDHGRGAEPTALASAENPESGSGSSKTGSVFGDAWNRIFNGVAMQSRRDKKGSSHWWERWLVRIFSDQVQVLSDRIPRKPRKFIGGKKPNVDSDAYGEYVGNFGHCVSSWFPKPDSKETEVDMKKDDRSRHDGHDSSSKHKPKVQVMTITQEFGTVPSVLVFQALRIENSLFHARDSLRSLWKSQMKYERTELECGRDVQDNEDGGECIHNDGEKGINETLKEKLKVIETRYEEARNLVKSVFIVNRPKWHKSVVKRGKTVFYQTMLAEMLMKDERQIKSEERRGKKS